MITIENCCQRFSILDPQLYMEGANCESFANMVSHEKTILFFDMVECLTPWETETRIELKKCPFEVLNTTVVCHMAQRHHHNLIGNAVLEVQPEEALSRLTIFIVLISASS
jgi:hypothetical protein